jgi:predicted O-methyltransferase YrrM
MSLLPETRLELEALLQGRPIDFLMIDGDHRYEGVKSDFLLYSCLMKEGGLIAFHDILLHPQVSACEVEKLWKQISPLYQNITFTDPDDDRGWGQWGGIVVLTYSHSVEPLLTSMQA